MENRDSYDLGIRVYPPNPYDVAATQSETESRHLRSQAAAQQYLSSQMERIRKLWSELRFADSMMNEVEILQAFWTPTAKLLDEAAEEGVDLGRAYVSWRIDHFRFIGTKWDVESMYRSAKEELARLAGIEPAGWDPVFTSVQKDAEEQRASGFDNDFKSADKLSQIMRVTQARSRLAELKARQIPWLDHIQGTIGEQSSDFDRESWSVQVAVSLPIFSWVNGEASQQKVQLDAEESTLALIIEEEERAVKRAREKIIQKEDLLKLHEQQIIPLVQQMKDQLSNTTLQEQSGVAVQVDLANSVLRAFETYYELQRDLEQVLIEFDTRQGRIP